MLVINKRYSKITCVILIAISHPIDMQGAVVVVSHDQFFVNEVAREAWVVNLGAVKQVESFAVYRQKQLAKLNKTK